MPVDVDTIIKRGEQLKNHRSRGWDGNYQRLRQYLRPNGTPFTSTVSPGQQNRQHVLDNTGEDASETLSSALDGMLTSAGQQWFFLTLEAGGVDAETYEESLWLQDATRRMLAVFNSPVSQFVTQRMLLYRDYVDYGTGGLFIEDRPAQIPLMRGRPLAELYIDEGEDGRVDTVARFFELSARQADQRFGKRAGPKASEAAEDPKKSQDLFQFMHIVYPRTDRVPGVQVSSNLPVASVWVNLTEKVVVRESGFHEMPYVVPRWHVMAGEVYGRGPGWKALPDVQMLQRAMNSQIRGAEKAIDPAYMLPDDGIMSNLKFTGNALNYIRSDLMMARQDPIRPVPTGSRPDLGDVFLQDLRGRIGQAFYMHLLTVGRDPRMTATQYIGIVEETLRVLGPIVSRLYTEFLGPLIDRVFGIMWRGGMFAPPPESLRGKPLKPEYTSPIARAQRLNEARAVAQTNDIMNTVLAADPNVMDNLDSDKAYRGVSELLGMPSAWLRSTDDVEARREARREADAAQRQEESLVNVAGAIGQAAPLIDQMGAANAA